ncbi:COG4315 family predicted lipoprotein [Chromobacterium haemolyticum]|uniref:COG4315 family predicted lipoprotein n=1 Tax=Chromobacterium haemolyticum TaxID=394935 RepID=UPI0009D9D600|nr:hypothetical protein [Chromobacterium haemolyticum]OQS31478.1 hypothetical protein B0T39_24105 [Chromobacterium haemolyticum]
MKAWMAVALTALSMEALAGEAASMRDGALVDAQGMTLYVFDKDMAGSGRSVCNQACAALWPPLLAAADDSAPEGFSQIRRDDGQAQWAYQGKPLYRFAKDGKPGERAGDGFKEVWHVAR